MRSGTGQPRSIIPRRSLTDTSRMARTVPTTTYGFRTGTRRRITKSLMLMRRPTDELKEGDAVTVSERAGYLGRCWVSDLSREWWSEDTDH
jgi:hypothetical protein